MQFHDAMCLCGNDAGSNRPSSIAGHAACVRGSTDSELPVGDVRHDLHEQHERWLLEQYQPGARS
jgi:hypothetical protein